MEEKGGKHWMRLEIEKQETATIEGGDTRCPPPVRQRRMRKLLPWWPTFLLPISALIVIIARNYPWGVERFYSEGLYPVLAGSIGRVTSLAPFSVWEIFLLLLVAGGLSLLIGFLVPPWRKKLFSLPFFQVDFWHWIRRGCNLAGIIVGLFVFLCGLNYYRPEFASFSDLTVRDSSLQELASLYVELAERANQLRLQVLEDEQGVMQLDGFFSQVAKEAREAFSLLSEQYPVLPDLPLTPKPVLNSWLMSRAQITGQFTFTYEANINVLAPDYTIPATMCHELAHTRGFMREDEANFIAYLACLESAIPQVQYSGVMLALVHTDNRLYAADPQLFYQLSQILSPGVRRDFSYNNSYWAQFEDQVIAQVSEVVNDTYLKVNSQTDGTQSYGRMVDLLLADFRQRHGLESH